MNIPGFTAEASVCKSTGKYARGAARVVAMENTSLVPQQDPYACCWNRCGPGRASECFDEWLRI